MGWTVLYIAFGIVALWLLGEVLLQYKARLRWRLLAFAGFLGVVLGVLIANVVVIGLGAAAFAVGQTYVTLSFRSGFAGGWAVGNRSREDDDGGGGSKRRRGGGRDRQGPAQEVSGLDENAAGTYRQDDAYGHDDHDDDVFTPVRPAASAAETTAVYSPEPLPEDTGSYAAYNDAPYAADQAQGQDQNFGYEGYSGYDQQQYGYDPDQQQHTAYSDPYIGTQTYDGGAYDNTAYGDQEAYAQQGYGQDQYGTDASYGETSPGGVWVPQQRTTDDPYGGEFPPEQQYPYQEDGNGQGGGPGGGPGGQGYDEQQYRF